MTRYQPRHSSRYRESERTAPVRWRARRWTAITAVVMTLLIWVAIATSGGIDVAWRTLSGEDLKERDAEIRAEFDTEASGSSESVTETAGD
jgi:hypothetical protein